MGWEILSLLGSIAMIIAGASGEYVLRGTESSMGLVIVGVLWLIYDIYRLATHRSRKEQAELAAAQAAEAELLAEAAQAANLPKEN